MEREQDLIEKIVACRRKRFARDGYSFNEGDSYQLAQEVINTTRNDCQLQLLQRFVTIKDGMRVCEIGTGHGGFIVTAALHGVDAVGVEFDPDILEVSKEILTFFEIDPDRVRRGKGEELPFDDDSFDVVVTSSVLEHVQDVQKVIDESLRVAKPGGVVIHNFPNYRSFFEGHFKSLWLPFLGKRSGKYFIRLMDALTGNLHRRNIKDYEYLDTLQLTSYKTVSTALKRHPEAEMISDGKEIWRERLGNLDLSVYWGVDWLHAIVKIIRGLKMTRLLAWAGIIFGFYTPIVLVVRKNPENVMVNIKGNI